jgi:hypothetical protein
MVAKFENGIAPQGLHRLGELVALAAFFMELEDVAVHPSYFSFETLLGILVFSFVLVAPVGVTIRGLLVIIGDVVCIFGSTAALRL